jgi:uncharacterized protein YndB with AHSA1/START domain
MAIDVVVDTRIERPIEDVFTELSDLDQWPDWLVATGVRHIRRASSGQATPGELLVIDQVAAGRASRFSGTVTALQPPTRLAIEGTDQDGVSVAITVTLASLGPTSTAMRLAIRVDVPFRFRIFEGLARPQVERAVRLDGEAVRRRLESAAPD